MAPTSHATGKEGRGREGASCMLRSSVLTKNGVPYICRVGGVWNGWLRRLPFEGLLENAVCSRSMHSTCALVNSSWSQDAVAPSCQMSGSEKPTSSTLPPSHPVFGGLRLLRPLASALTLDSLGQPASPQTGVLA